MTGASFSFSIFAVVAVVAAAGAMITRQPRRTLASFAVAAAALIVPMIQLRAPLVAGAMLLSATVSVALLAGLLRLAPEPQRHRRRHSLAFSIPAVVGLGGFVWVLLATGSRQFVDSPPPLAAGHDFGDGDLTLLAFSTDFMVPAVLVGMLALCAVLAAVLALVAGPAQPSASS